MGDVPGGDISVNELVLAYFKHVQNYYRDPDGLPTTEVQNIRMALRWAKNLYGQTEASRFDGPALEAVRGKMIEAGLCRNRINKDVARLKRMWKWGVSKNLVPVTTFQALSTVEGLRQGRSEAHETDPIGPVAECHVEATLPHMLPQVAAMVRLQLLTGMRPGEVVRLRGIDLDASGEVWLYRPGSDRGRHGAHKTAHKGKDRVVAVGPRAQEVLRPWLRLDLLEYLFQPGEAMASFRAEQRKSRKSKVPPSQQNRKKAGPRKKPGVVYTVDAYGKSIAKAVGRHNREDAEVAAKEGREPRPVPHWHPNQLRHTRATEVRREFGLEAAQVTLGHARADVTQVYAERDRALAEKIALAIG
jgi:integrase